MTYAETQNKPPFDWRKALANPQGNGRFLAELASSWTTCACGNQCDIIPRHYNGQPFDEILARLGSRFLAAIVFENYRAAKKVLEKIEIRSATLIEELKLEGFDPNE